VIRRLFQGRERDIREIPSIGEIIRYLMQNHTDAVKEGTSNLLKSKGEWLAKKETKRAIIGRRAKTNV